jgi:hypothetical protein
METEEGSNEVSFDMKTLELSSTTGTLNLSGVMRTSGFQGLLPWRAPGGNTDLMYYMCQMYLMEGDYLGERVHGYSMIEHMWSSRTWRDTWWFQNRPSHHSVHSLTTYRDGTAEMFRVWYGQYGARGAVVVDSEGQVILSTGEFNVERQSSGRYVYTFVDGPQWEFVPEHPGTNFPAIVKRVGETREVDKGYAYTGAGIGELRQPAPIGQTKRSMG